MESEAATEKKGDFAVLWRFLPMLWPKDDVGLRLRVVAALLLVLLGKAISLAMPFAYKAIVDGMSADRQALGVVVMLVVAYAAARFGGVLADNLRVMDASAVALCRDNNIPIVVFSIREQGNLAKVLAGEGVQTTVQKEA